jgi:hypothetical protein
MNNGASCYVGIGMETTILTCDNAARITGESYPPPPKKRRTERYGN